jgi:predicted CxxxxCH...CXXCH cytochrome family protein
VCTIQHQLRLSGVCRACAIHHTSSVMATVVCTYAYRYAESATYTTATDSDICDHFGASLVLTLWCTLQNTGCAFKVADAAFASRRRAQLNTCSNIYTYNNGHHTSSPLPLVVLFARASAAVTWSFNSSTNFAEASLAYLFSL